MTVARLIVLAELRQRVWFLASIARVAPLLSVAAASVLVFAGRDSDVRAGAIALAVGFGFAGLVRLAHDAIDARIGEVAAEAEMLVALVLCHLRSSASRLTTASYSTSPADSHSPMPTTATDARAAEIARHYAVARAVEIARTSPVDETGVRAADTAD